LRKTRFRWIKLFLRTEIEFGSRGLNRTEPDARDGHDKGLIVIPARWAVNGQRAALRKRTPFRRCAGNRRRTWEGQPRATLLRGKSYRNGTRLPCAENERFPLRRSSASSTSVRFRETRQTVEVGRATAK